MRGGNLYRRLQPLEHVKYDAVNGHRGCARVLANNRSKLASASRIEEVIAGSE